ncbi:hypothetical protein BKA65DRAFT_557747 [Rhexocercosporidium sp. MPI-PUGE-AT-0058]|nr:hypothetical protein BKA65DRAFT_557747 [Rhexocercosporidium sp. MPI-PUGE-AT-0058]
MQQSVAAETLLSDASLQEDSTQEPSLAPPFQPRTTQSFISRKPLLPRSREVQYSVLPRNEAEDNVFPVRSEAKQFVNSQQSSWIPYVLEWPWMLSVIAFGVILFAIVVVFHIISIRSEGVTDDTGSPMGYFAWRFLPTLLAVAYVTMIMIILDGVKRTENLARLAKKSSSSASASILRTPGSWWTALADSFPRKGNDSRFSSTMLCTVLAYILGFLIISPFSSALLSSKDMKISSKSTMLRIQPTPGQTLQLRLDTTEFFGAVGHTVQNVVTSPWITENYSVLPFWPAQIERPSGSRFNAVVGDWTAETFVYQSGLLCEDLELESGPNVINYTYAETDFDGERTLEVGYRNLTSIQMTSKSGCKYGVSYSQPISLKDRFYWSNLTDVNIPTFWNFFRIDEEVLLNHTALCEPGEVLLTIPNDPSNSTLEIAGKICRQSYFEAKLPVTVSVSADATTCVFDQVVFERERLPVDNDKINITAFHEAFFSSDWNDYLREPTFGTRPDSGGPANLLAAMYNFNLTGMVKDPDFAARAKHIKQYSFGQALQSALQSSSTVSPVEGDIIVRQRRIVVATAVAFTLEVVLALATFLLVAAFWTSRRSRRPLGLSQDIGVSNTVASLVAAQYNTSQDLQEISSMSAQQARQVLNGYSYAIENGALRMIASTPNGLSLSSTRSVKVKKRDRIQWEPKVLSTWAIIGLIFVLSALLVTIAVLYWYSKSHGLYQSSFVYQVEWNIGDHSLGYIAPYSIIPTLFAVIVGLWWGALESIFRTAQPFISMAKGPTTGGKGSGLSYQSSYLAWAGIRAVSRQHWLLAFVCTGAFLSQILAISMSALWQREPFQLERPVEVAQPFQIRDVPFLYDKGSYHKTAKYKQDILANAFQNLETNWMYSAALQLTMNASQPAWSSDSWSFVPVFIPNSFETVRQQTNSSSNEPQRKGYVATVNVPAVRGRLQCSPLAPDIEDRFWLTEVDLTAKSRWNQTLKPRPWESGYVLGCGGNTRSGINYNPNMTDLTGTSGNCSYIGGYTTVLAEIIVTCCAQESEHQPDNASIGYWSPVNLRLYDPDLPSRLQQTDNFTVKWIHGPAPVDYPNESGQLPSLIWPEPPKLSMLNCAPIVETASASVTVDLATNNVQAYTILDDPVSHSEAFSDDFVAHRGDDPTFFNVTASFGTMFVAALLGAAQIKYIGGCAQTSRNDCYEDDTDRTFTYRAPGMNLDHMSYSMLQLAQNNQESLLNHTKLQELAEITFTTFFQHFASQNVLLDGSGGWVFQRANETLPVDLPPPDTQYDASKVGPARVAMAASPSITATVSQPVEILRMSPVAVWLCIVILAWLIITTIAILVLKNRYFSPLLRGVDTIADVAMMVAGSERYLELARREGASGLRADKTFRTRLGWFRTGGGEVRWGIELADDEEVQFLSEEEVKLLFANGDQRVKAGVGAVRRDEESPLPDQRRPGFI